MYLKQSDFDRFINSTIERPLYHDPDRVTALIQKYLDDNSIDDPRAFFASEMRPFSYYKSIHEQYMKPSSLKFVKKNGADAYVGFTKDYKKRIIDYTELRIFVFYRDGVPRVSAMFHWQP